MNPVTENIIRNRLLELTKKYSDKNAREYYWKNCIFKYSGSTGNPPESDESEDEYSVAIKELRKPSTIRPVRRQEYYNQSEISYNESRQMSAQSNVSRSMRTFIGPLDDTESSNGNRLSQINTWVSVTPEDVDIRNVNELITDTLTALKIDLSTEDNIRKISLNMYFNILTYYSNGNPLKLKTNRGNIKRGYMILIIYYALRYYNKNISLETIVSKMPDSRISYIPDADKLIKRIFEGNENYSFIFNNTNEPLYVQDLCSLMNSMESGITRKINKVKKHLVDAGKFERILLPVQIAACIYFVYSVSASNGGIHQKRLKIEFQGQAQNVTHELLVKQCKGFSGATLKKVVDEIISFYRQNYSLLSEL